MSPERAPGEQRPLLGMAALLALAVVGCGTGDADEHAPAAETWAVTAWGERFEVFPEVGALVAGEPAVAHTHVTRLDGFAPLATGEVSIVLTGAGRDQVFTATEPDRPGVFAVELTPGESGDYDLAFRVRDAAGTEEIRGGRVRVGSPSSPGGLRVAPAPKGGTDGGEPFSYLKEQQWQSDFGTDWVRTARLPGSVSGLARVRPPAGGEATITAPVAGVVQPPGAGAWPFVGLEVGGAQPLFRVTPLVSSDRSLPALESDLATLASELQAARTRLGRLEELAALDAASERELEEARTRVETLASRHSAAARDLGAARSARQGGASGHDLVLRAPFAGALASVAVTPGTTVEAGEPLARLVGTELAWIEVEVPPAGARRIAREGVSGIVLVDPELGPARIEEGLRPVSIAPEVAADTGTVTVLLEAPRAASPAFGATVEAQVLTAAARQGIVLPDTAIVDDGGVSVVYLQLAGETFVRQQVEVVERQGDRVLVAGLVPGQRVVTRGGDAIRRASLMATGEAHGHVH